MLLLVTVLLVVGGLVLLLVGFVQDSLTLIYLSIGCAAVAGVALTVFGRLSRRRALRLVTDGAPSTLPATADPVDERPAQPAGAADTADTAAEGSGGEESVDPA